jgi:hypothetical protein
MCIIRYPPRLGKGLLSSRRAVYARKFLLLKLLPATSGSLTLAVIADERRPVPSHDTLEPFARGPPIRHIF